MALVPRSLAALRHPRERPVLWLTLIPLIAWLLMAGGTTLGWLLLLGAAGWLWLWIQARLQQTRLMATGVQVSATQLSHLADMLTACQAKVPLSGEVDLIVVQAPTLRAYTFAMHQTQVIVVTSALVDTLTPNELQAVIAHEWGHLALGHPLWGSVFGVLTQLGMVRQGRHQAAHTRRGLTSSRFTSSTVNTVLHLAATLLVPLLFLAYRRYSELSADRVALMITGNANGLCGALTKLMVGPGLAAQLSESALIEQAERVSRSWWGRWHLAEMGHPFIGTRLKVARRALPQSVYPPRELAV